MFDISNYSSWYIAKKIIFKLTHVILCDFKSFLSDFNLTQNSYNLHNSCTLHNLYGKVNFLKHIKKTGKTFLYVYFVFICFCLFLNTEMFLKMKNYYWLSIEKNYSNYKKWRLTYFLLTAPFRCYKIFFIEIQIFFRNIKHLAPINFFYWLWQVNPWNF